MFQKLPKSKLWGAAEAYRVQAETSLTRYQQVLDMGIPLSLKTWLDWEHYGPITEESLEASFLAYQKKKHREDQLLRTKVREQLVSRCYRTGSEVWVRKDGGPLTEMDLESIRALSYGQSTETRAKPGDTEALVSWACDSGD